MLQKEDIASIRKSFGKECIQIYKKYKDNKTGEEKILIGYKPQYIIERLNDCFGHDGWDFEIRQIEEKNSCAYCWGRLTIFASAYMENEDIKMYGAIKRSVVCVKDQIGSCEYRPNEISYGDALKGAATNCLEKCASLLDIGHEAYKGLVEYEGKTSAKKASPEEKTEKVEDKEEANIRTELRVLCKEYGIGNQAFIAMIKNVLKVDKEMKDLNIEDYKKLLNHVKINKSPF